MGICHSSLSTFPDDSNLQISGPGQKVKSPKSKNKNGGSRGSAEEEMNLPAGSTQTGPNNSAPSSSSRQSTNTNRVGQSNAVGKFDEGETELVLPNDAFTMNRELEPNKNPLSA